MEFPFDRPSFFAPADDAPPLPIWPVGKGDPDGWAVPDGAKKLAKAVGFTGESGAFLVVPGDNADHVAGALFGLGTKDHEQPLAFGRLPSRIAIEGPWAIDAPTHDRELATIGLALGGYRFDRYKSSAKKPAARFVMPDGVDAEDVERQIAGSFLARDLINTPANDMGPEALEAAFRALAERYGAHVSAIVGDDLLTGNFPMIHAVGRASAEAPRLLDMRWGRSGDPKVTLVGKGVCFDTGGLDIKPASGMLLMKKDMGGAANVLGLALMIMDAGLKVDLRVLVPAVENSISANAFRPGDILKSRAGLTVEIANTDAEGRLVLADALTLADAEEPDLLIDMATLTGAARVALGPDLPPYYSDDEVLAADIAESAAATHDPAWRLPLHMGYDGDLSSKVADINNAPSGGFAGSITAALFLKRFVVKTRSWAHFDIYGWTPKEKAHAPVGGEAQCIRALYRLLKKRYG